jgi:ABC-type transport system substrate-binding protein
LIGLVQAQLRRVGVEVVPQFATSNTLFGQILASGAFDIALFAYSPSGPGPAPNGVFTCGGDANYTGYCQRLVTRDLDQADRILDAGRQARVLNRADAQLARDVPVIPLFQPPLAVYVRAEIQNYVDRFPAAPWNAEDWWLER